MLAETGFIKRFIDDKEVMDELKVGLEMLVDTGKIEIVNGGLSANDEACSYYESIMD